MNNYIPMSNPSTINQDLYKGIEGTSIDLNLEKYCGNEIRADLVVNEFEAIRIWGQIKNCNGNPIPYALVKLLKIYYHTTPPEYLGIAHTVSDEQGFYQFDITPEDHSFYKVLVNKSTNGPVSYSPEASQSVSNNHPVSSQQFQLPKIHIEGQRSPLMTELYAPEYAPQTLQSSPLSNRQYTSPEIAFNKPNCF